ncbi:WXG100 family type VII secretion target [Umezawaea sp. NPDC059074]|uniref:WXG100 family type VII secretion target n=1 Tax=Umezawaea sp. NPDC059074 TaxID=3346716 RepID=UPI0036A3844F
MSQPTYTYSGGINAGVSSEMMDAHSKIKAELLALDTDMRQSLTHWQTPTSKQQYELSKQRWDNAADTMPQSLQIASSTLENITLRMNKTEDAVTDSWS